jgi:rubrerythrin
MTYYRCRICGEVYMGCSAPTNCPYCGAPGVYLVEAKDWTDENETITELSKISLSNLEKAIQLEVNNTLFYREASWRADTIELQGIFKCLSKTEKEHVSVLGKILKHDPPELTDDREIAVEDDMTNLRVAKALEEYASSFYALSATQAVEERVKVVFTALSEIESEHIKEEGRLLNE